MDSACGSEFPCNNMDSACGSEFSYIGTYSNHTQQNTSEITSASDKISIYESMDFFNKPASSYFIATEDGRLSPEFLGPPIKIPNCSVMVVCTIYSRDLFISSSKMYEFLSKYGYGIKICIFVPGVNPSMKENLWLKRRGLRNIYGDILLTSQTFGHDEIFTSTKDAVEIVEQSLNKKKLCILDKIKNLNKIEEMEQIGCMPKINRPCMLCGKCKLIAKEIICSCGRKHYCGKKCQKIDWNEHKESELHRGFFL